ncbi:MAG: hypothetical protein HON04_07655, partial [Planctomicrobium sp.]|nr:hypothetical protein [Planctomicrobium sp.]
MYRRQSPASQHDRQVSNCQLAKRRAGLITFWALVTIPVFLTMLCVILEVGNLWAARIQLKNALEAAALAGVQEWGDQVIANPAMKDTMASRTTAIAYAGANVVNGAPVVLLANYNGANTNQNNDCTIITDADLVFGTTEVNGSNEYVFNAALSDGCGVNA